MNKIKEMTKLLISFLFIFYFINLFGVIVHEIGHYVAYKYLGIDSIIEINIGFFSISGMTRVIPTDYVLKTCKPYGFWIGLSGGLFGFIFRIIVVEITKYRSLHIHSLWEIMYAICEGFVTAKVFNTGNYEYYYLLYDFIPHMVIFSTIIVGIFVWFKEEKFHFFTKMYDILEGKECDAKNVKAKK